MKSVLILVLFCVLAQNIQAHWILSKIGVDGRLGAEGAHQNRFGPGLHSGPTQPADSHPNMKCGPLGVPNAGVPSFQANPGDRIAARWLHDREFVRFDVAHNANHHGPCMAYVAPKSSGGNGAVWTKIWESGMDRSKNAGNTGWASKGWEGPFVGWWCSDQVRVDNGFMRFPLPRGLPNGDYLLRVEMISTKLPGAGSTAQAYVACANMRVGGGGNARVLPNAVSFPEAYRGHPWIHFLLYGGYPNVPGIPGPAVWRG